MNERDERLANKLIWGEVYELPADDKIANQLYLNQAGCEGFQENGFVDLNIDQIMERLYANQVTAAGYVAIVLDSRTAETQQALQGQKAFRQVLDNPSAVKALECWAMKPPLELV